MLHRNERSLLTTGMGQNSAVSIPAIFFLMALRITATAFWPTCQSSALDGVRDGYRPQSLSGKWWSSLVRSVDLLEKPKAVHWRTNETLVECYRGCSEQ